MRTPRDKSPKLYKTPEFYVTVTPTVTEQKTLFCIVLQSMVSFHKVIWNKKVSFFLFFFLDENEKFLPIICYGSHQMNAEQTMNRDRW